MRPRKINRHLPKCVHHRHGGYYLVKRGKWTLLGHEIEESLKRYAELTAPPTSGLDSLIDDALKAMSPKLASNTVKQYKVAAAKIKYMLSDFTEPQQILPRHVAQLKLSLAATPNMANRCLSFLRCVFNYALENQLIDSNPATGIKGHQEQTRRRLVTMDEYAAIYAAAPPRLQVTMDLYFYTGQRVRDVLQIKVNDLQDEGIYFEQDKTEARLVVAWTPELRAVVARAKTLPRNQFGQTLLQGRRGKPVDYKSVYDQWVRACEKAGIADTDMRDIRAMAATAIRSQGGNATALLGHKSTKMTERYLRDKTIPVVTGPSFNVVKLPVQNSGK